MENLNNSLNCFIIGMPRSGTKLLRNLLNNHSDIYIPEIETLFIPFFLKKYGSKILNEDEIQDVINEIRSSLFMFYYHNNDNFNYEKLKVNNSTIQNLLSCFFEELKIKANKNAKIIGDKSPNNINDIDVLLKYYKSAKFIHIVRDPRDYALSVKNAWNKNKERAIYKWVQGIEKIQNFITSHKDQILEIKYEELIEDSDSTLRKCIGFLGVEYNDKMNTLIKPVENLGDARTAIIDSNNKFKYLQKMTPKEIEKFERYTIEYLIKYNYKYNTKERTNKAINKTKDKFLRLFDIFNLLLFNIKTHGFTGGIIKMIKASKN